MALGDHKKHKPNWSLENATFSCSLDSSLPVTLSIPLLGINQTKQKGDDGADVLRGRYFASSSPPSLPPCLLPLLLQTLWSQQPNCKQNEKIFGERQKDKKLHLMHAANTLQQTDKLQAGWETSAPLTFMLHVKVKRHCISESNLKSRGSQAGTLYLMLQFLEKLREVKCKRSDGGEDPVCHHWTGSLLQEYLSRGGILSIQWGNIIYPGGNIIHPGGISIRLSCRIGFLLRFWKWTMKS